MGVVWGKTTPKHLRDDVFDPKDKTLRKRGLTIDELEVTASLTKRVHLSCHSPHGVKI